MIKSLQPFNKRSLGAVLLLSMILFGFTSSVSAVGDPTITFEWTCQNTAARTCTFDASGSDPSPFIWRFWYEFGDGTTSGHGGPIRSHAYPAGATTYDVTLHVIRWGTPSAQEVTCTIDPPWDWPFGPPAIFTTGTCTS